MKVIYYHPRFLTASFLGAYLHTRKNDAPINMVKIEEILGGLKTDNPFILYFGRGEKGEEVFLLNGTCTEDIIKKTVESLLCVHGKNNAELIFISPLSGSYIFLNFYEGLGIHRIKEAAYRYYLAEIEAAVQRAHLQLQIYNTER